MDKERILGVDICNTNYEVLKKCVKEDIDSNKKSFIVAINPEKIILANKNKKMMKILNEATYQIPDGIGIVYASKIMKGKIFSRITGIDFMNTLCQLADEYKYRIFLYGSTKDVIENVEENLKKKYKDINIVGKVDGFEEKNEEIIEKINEANTNILFVALGSPLQEEWIWDNKDKLKVNIMQGVGGSFDVLAGKVKRAPNWIIKLGLEWLYRAFKEPVRIKRLKRNISFSFKVLLNINKRAEYDSVK